MATPPTTGNGTNAGETISALAGNDRLWGGAGNDEIDGGTGTNAAYFSGNQAQYQITTSWGVTEVKDLRGQGSKTPDGIDKVVNVKRLIFADGYRLPVPDQAPDAKGDAASTNEDTPILIDVLGNDTDADADTLRILFLSDADITKPGNQTAAGATISVEGSQVRYDPTTSAQLQALNAGQSLTDSFSYTVSDGFGGTDTATVSVDVSGAADIAPNFDGQTSHHQFFGARPETSPPQSVRTSVENDVRAGTDTGPMNPFYPIDNSTSRPIIIPIYST